MFHAANKNKGLFLLTIGGAFLFLLLWPGRYPCPFLCLNIYHLEGQKQALIYSLPLTPGEEVILGYTHSSDGTPVEQVFLIGAEGSLVLVEERYRWYGAGLEFGSGYTVTFSDGWVRVSGYDRSFAALPVRVAGSVPQVISVNQATVLLSDLAPAAARLLVKVEQAPRQLLRMRRQ